MQLSEEQKSTVRAWVAEGTSLSAIQTRIKSEFDQSVTYMDVRMLVSELEVAIPEPPEPEPVVPPAETPAATLGAGPGPGPNPAAPANASPDLTGKAPAAGNVTVTVDEITPPHAVISGKVTFSDGVKADWYLDEMGRLGLNASTPGYRPSEPDVITFQKELQRVVRSQGMY